MERTIPGIDSRTPGKVVEAGPIAESTQRLAHYLNSLRMEERTLPIALAEDFGVLTAETSGSLADTLAIMATALRNIPQYVTASEALPVEKTKKHYEHETPFGTLTLNPERKSAQSPLTGQQDLTIKLVDLFQCLIEDPTAIHNPDEIIEKVWGISRDDYVSASLRVLVADLKAKIGPIVYNVRGRGYSLTPTNPEDPNSWLPQNRNALAMLMTELIDIKAKEISEPPHTNEASEPTSYTVFSGRTKITLYTGGQTVYSSKTGEEKRLGPQEYLLLRSLMINPAIVSIEQIRKDVWPEETDLPENQLAKRAAKLVERVRIKLGGNEQSPIISTVRGKGYQIASRANPSNPQ